MTVEAFLSPEAIAAVQAAEAASDKKQKRTPEQIEAIYTNGQNVLVSASAGSGKTFVMVERIVDQICRGISLDQLFISTFTVKAAGELKERIEKKLTQVLQETADMDLRRHIAEQMSRMEQADIGTMDAFAQRLVTRYGYSLGVAPQFRILQDKNEQDLLKADVYADLFTSYATGKDKDLFHVLVRNFTGNSKDSKKFYQLVDQVYQFSQATSHPRKWLTDTLLKGHRSQDHLDSIPSSMVAGLVDSILEAAASLEALTESPDYAQVTKAGKPTAAYTKHLQWVASLRQAVQEFHSGQGTLSLPDLIERVQDILPSGDGITVAKVKHPIFKRVQVRVQELAHLETVLSYQGEALPLLELLQRFVLDFSDQYLQVKMQENAYEFADISHLAIAILEQNKEIREHFQARYHEVMVDEYQDNNHTQERLLNLLSNGHNRFMVGDIKQSIYRFRQADPQIFQSTFEKFQADPDAGKLILLKENFRSQTEVLDATNAVFTRLMDQQVGDIAYDENHTLVAGSARQIIAQPEHQATYLLYDTNQESDEDGAAISGGEIKAVIKEIIHLHEKKGVAFKDITLLVPSRTRNEAIVAAFEQHGIPLVADGGEASYLQSLEVMVMLDTLRTISNPLQDYALLALLKSPMFGFDEDELARIALQAKSGAFYEKMLQAQAGGGEQAQLITPHLLERLQGFQEVFNRWRSLSRTSSLYDLIWTIFNDRFYYDYVGALPNGAKRQANLQALGLRANQFEQTGFKGLSRFIGMIDKVLASDNDLADVPVFVPQDAVQLMTVHKSKGLEFAYVFLLNMDKAFNAEESRSSFLLSRKNGIGIQYVADMKPVFETSLPHVRVSMKTLPYVLNQRELKLAHLSEQMRLLYVAMTRAEKKLYLVGKGNPDKLLGEKTYQQEAGVLAASEREHMRSFQEWVLAIYQAFGRERLPLEVRVVRDEDLTPESIGQLSNPSQLVKDSLVDNRQSDAIAKALEQLETVEALNQTYRAAIELPSVRTPSQVKPLYEPILEAGEVAVMQKEWSAPQFVLPDFSSQTKVTGAQVGSAVHNLMQALPLDQPITRELVERVLNSLPLDPAVKAEIVPDKVVAFFETDLGLEILSAKDRVRREATFALLQTDPNAQEEFVLRGIVDGFILYDDRIVLFDYKTDRYTHPSQLVARYTGQMSLYAQALRQAYQIDQVDSYLILLGGKQIEVVRL